MKFVSISAGGGHTCGVTFQGGVECWGGNQYGQLGDGTTKNRTVPVSVVGLSSGVVAVSAGQSHTCALTASGGVKCGGYNWRDQLGDGTTTDSSVPVDVRGLSSGMKAVAAGDLHTCALTSAGGVKCWGYNEGGTLGDGTTTDSSLPVKVTGLSYVAVSAIAAGGAHTCALITRGAMKCWGWNREGQLGDGTTDNRHAAVDVTGLSSWVLVVAAGGYHTCALISGGRVQCWGENAGQLGDGTGIRSSVPVDAIWLSGRVIAIGAGGDHTCALIYGGKAQCWGNNHYGQLGNGTKTDSLVPVKVTGLAGKWREIAAGGGHTCVLGSDGMVECWGANGGGQLGDGTTITRSIPVGIKAIPSIPTATSATLPTPSPSMTESQTETP